MRSHRRERASAATPITAICAQHEGMFARTAQRADPRFVRTDHRAAGWLRVSGLRPSTVHRLRLKQLSPRGCRRRLSRCCRAGRRRPAAGGGGASAGRRRSRSPHPLGPGPAAGNPTAIAVCPSGALSRRSSSARAAPGLNGARGRQTPHDQAIIRHIASHAAYIPEPACSLRLLSAAGVLVGLQASAHPAGVQSASPSPGPRRPATGTRRKRRAPSMSRATIYRKIRVYGVAAPSGRLTRLRFGQARSER